MQNHQSQDTIVALASGVGKAGVAVIRLSGPSARSAALALCERETLLPRRATHVWLRAQGQPIDEALALYFPAPHSFTGEDVVELQTHGAQAVIRAVLEALTAQPDVRLAQPGEFTRRAFDHGKRDLLQSEAVADLIDAQTPQQLAQALRVLGGAASEQTFALRQDLLEAMAPLEAYIDFPDEEIPTAVLQESAARCAQCADRIAQMLADRGVGERIRSGIEIVLTGPPNAGKSSLLNRLAQRDAAIVSPEPGTTRDLIAVPMQIAGYAVTLIDTAGLRDAAGDVEAEGIRRAQAAMAAAELVLVLQDATEYQRHRLPPDLGEASPHSSPQTSRHLWLLNKSDLAPELVAPPGALVISCASGEGLDELESQLAGWIAQRMASAEPPIITQARHREALTRAAEALQRASAVSEIELRCEELRLAARAVGSLTGTIVTDELLDRVFARFCIGK